MNEVRDRLKQFIKSQSMSVKAFELSIGAGNGYVNSIVNSIGSKYLPVILEKYPKLNREWLLFGDGTMLREETQPHQDNCSSDNFNGEQIVLKDGDTHEFINLLKKKDEQIDRMLAIIEKMQGI